MDNRLKIFSGSSCPELAARVCKKLGVNLSPVQIEQYSNGCFEVILGENIRGCKVFLIQTSPLRDLHQNLWELYEMVNAACKASAKEINVVMPYVSYARSDKKYTGRMPIAGKLFTQFLETAGMDRFVGIDFHSPEFEGFFDLKTRVDHLRAYPLIINFLKSKDLTKAVLLPGDDGASKKVAKFSEGIGVPCGNVKKRRISDTKVIIDSIEGEIKDKDVFIIDDEICAATTIKEVGKKVEELGANSLTVVATHGLFVGKAIDNLKSIKILKEIAVTDTVPIADEVKKNLPLTIIPIDELLSRAILEIYQEGSVSKLFE